MLDQLKSASMSLKPASQMFASSKALWQIPETDDRHGLSRKRKAERGAHRLWLFLRNHLHAWRDIEGTEIVGFCDRTVNGST